MQTNRNDTIRFKKHLHGKLDAIYSILNDGKSENCNMLELSGPLDKCWDQIEQASEDYSNVFMGVNGFKDGKRTSKNAIVVNALFIDYDKGDWSAAILEQFLEKFAVPPSMVIETSPGNYHVYWRTEGVPLDKFKTLQQMLAAKFDSDPKVCDLARVMRMPGTINWKREGKPFLVRIVHEVKDATPVPYRNFVLGMLGASAWDEINQDRPLKNQTPVTKDSSSVEKNNLTKALANLPADDRDTWIKVGMALQDHYGSEGLSTWREWSSKSAKYDDKELIRQWDSFKTKGGITIATIFSLAKNASQPVICFEGKSTPTDALELASHFVEIYANVLKFSEQDNCWLNSQGGFWSRSPLTTEGLAIKYLRDMKALAAKSAVANFPAFIEKFQSIAGARELLNSAKSDARVAVKPNSFDSEPNVIGVKLPDKPGINNRHGVIILDDYKKRLASPDDLISRLAGPIYDGRAECPLWHAFLSQITEFDEELTAYIQLAIGYTLYGHTKEQVMFILFGSGANGKGVFSRIIAAMLGDYAAVMQSSLLKLGAINANAPSPALMLLRGKRFWQCSEMPKNMKLDDALIKQFTGGDALSTRELYSGQVEFVPEGKLWLSVNHLPSFRHEDKAMWRRIILIPFNAVFSGRNRDDNLEEKLRAELPGILNWAVEGARKYATRGLHGRPKASKELFAAMRRDADTIGVWIDNCCGVADNARLPSKVAYDNYVSAMKSENTNPLTNKEFKADLERRGYYHKKGSAGNFFLGLTITDA